MSSADSDPLRVRGLRSPAMVLAAGALALALVLGGLAFETQSRHGQFRRSAVSVEGTIVDFVATEEKEVLDTVERHHPVIEFRLPDGSSHRITSDRPVDTLIGGSSPDAALGQRLRLLLPPNEPGAARVDTGPWAPATAVLAGLSTLALLAAIALAAGWRPSLFGSTGARQRED